MRRSRVIFSWWGRERDAKEKILEPRTPILGELRKLLDTRPGRTGPSLANPTSSPIFATGPNKPLLSNVVNPQLFASSPSVTTMFAL